MPGCSSGGLSRCVVWLSSSRGIVWSPRGFNDFKPSRSVDITENCRFFSDECTLPAKPCTSITAVWCPALSEPCGTYPDRLVAEETEHDSTRTLLHLPGPPHPIQEHHRGSDGADEPCGWPGETG